MICRDVRSLLPLLAVFLSSCWVTPKCPQPNTPSSVTINTWNEVSKVFNADLLDGSATDSNTLYVSGFGGAYKTTNQGSTWEPVISGVSGGLYSIKFTDTKTGYTAGDFGTVLKTTDGGSTWSPISPEPGGGNFRCMLFINDSTVYLGGGNGVLYKSTNAGATWVKLTTNTNNHIYGIYFINDETGYLATLNYGILKTTNGGTSWTPLNTNVLVNVVSPILSSIHFVDSQTGFAVGGNGNPFESGPSLILKTSDGGTTWAEYPIHYPFHLTSINFLNSTTGFISGIDPAKNKGFILKTTNAGKSWELVKTIDSRLYKIIFPFSGLGFAIGFDGTVLKGNLSGK